MENIFVTAFFDIGRGDREKYRIPRGTDSYFNYFSHWCGVHNRLVCFCDRGMGERIKNIRREKGLLDKTDVIEMDIADIPEFSGIMGGETSLIELMLSYEENIHTQNIHFINNAMSGKARYSYVMYVKYICLQRAKEIYGENKFYTWIDFGFDKGGMRFQPSDFDKVWNPKVSVDKMSFFALCNPNDVSLLEMLILQADCMIGDLFIIPGTLCENLLQWGIEAIKSLLVLECYDDDQMIMLMIYRNHKEMIDVYYSTWVVHYAQVSSTEQLVKAHMAPRWVDKVIDYLKSVKHHRLSNKKRLKLFYYRIQRRQQELQRMSSEFEINTYGKEVMPVKKFKEENLVK